MHKKKYSIILPSYKESDNLKVLLPKLIKTADQFLLSYEVIVVDACKSLDETQKVCELHNVIYLNRSPRNVYGDAVRTGIQRAKGELIIFMDSDGSHPPEFLSEMTQYVDHYDLLIASRYVKGGVTENNMPLVFMSRVLNLIYSKLLKINCYDISNSFRVYRHNQLELLTLHCDNFDIIQEILFSLIGKNPNLKIKEIPFSFKKRIFGKSKRSMVIFIVSYFKTLMKLFWQYRIMKFYS